MGLTEKRFGGWCLLLGTAAVAVGYGLSPGRGAVDTVPSTSLTDLTLAMARNEALSYTVPIVILFGGLLILHGILTLRRHAGPVPRLGLLGMAMGLVLQMVMRGLDYMITGLGGGRRWRAAGKSHRSGSNRRMRCSGWCSGCSSPPSWSAWRV